MLCIILYFRVLKNTFAAPLRPYFPTLHRERGHYDELSNRIISKSSLPCFTSGSQNIGSTSRMVASPTLHERLPA